MHRLLCYGLRRLRLTTEHEARAIHSLHRLNAAMTRPKLEGFKAFDRRTPTDRFLGVSP